MAWTVSVRTRRTLAPSVARPKSKTDTGGPPSPLQLALTPTMLQTLSLVVQIAVLGAALAHISEAPILAALAILGGLISLAASETLRQSISVRIGRKKLPHAGCGSVVGLFDEEPTDSGTPTGTRAASVLPASSHILSRVPSATPVPASFNRIAPANDGAAWAGLCARLGHELRTPLNAVLGFSELMKEELHGPLGRSRYREYVSHIRDSGQALLKSTEDALAITAVLSNSLDQRCTARGLAVEPLLTDAWHFIEPLARVRSIGLELDVSPDLQICTEHRTLRQALINLFDEAMRHAGDGGRVSVRAASEHGMVTLEIRSGGNCQTVRPGDSLPLTLARALLELSGCTPEVGVEDGNWYARTAFDQPAQPDFFDDSTELRTVTA